MSDKATRLLVFLTAAALIASAVAYLTARAIIPFDGSVFIEEADATNSVVRVIQLYENGLRDGDLIVAVEGISLQQWADDWLAHALPRPDWRIGETAAYTVLRDNQELQLAQPFGRYPLGTIVAENWGAWVFSIGMTLVALFALSRKPDEKALQILLLAAACSLVIATQDATSVNDFLYSFIPAYGVFRFVLVLPFIPVLILHFVLVFPKPQPWLAGRPWVLPLIYLAPFLFLVVWAVVTWPGGPVTREWIVSLGLANIAFTFVDAVLILAAAIVSLRTARDPVSRTQIRWVLFAIILMVALTAMLQALPETLLGRSLVDDNVVAVLQLIVPVAIVISILRHGLFDIDVIIRRTTQYAIITGLLVLVYFGSVILLQRLFTAVTGQSSTIAVVLSTLLIAALFFPLRRRVQDLIDRRFYRRKYDAQKTLERFAATVRDETDLDALTAELVRVIEETMQPEHVSVWLAPDRLTVQEDARPETGSD